MMQRFKNRAAIGGCRFIEPILPNTGTIVDLGCGSGALAHRVAQGNPQLSVIAIDTELSKLATAMPAQQANLSFIEGDAYHLPLQNNCVDLLYLHAVCMYLNPIEKVLSEAYRVLKNNGKLALRNGLSVVNNMELFVDGSLFKKVLSHSLTKNKDDPNIAFALPPLLESLGFSSVCTETTIETSQSKDELEQVAYSTIELLDGHIGQSALADKIIKSSELESLKQGIVTWANDSKAYNKAVWIEHVCSKYPQQNKVAHTLVSV